MMRTNNPNFRKYMYALIGVCSAILILVNI